MAIKTLFAYSTDCSELFHSNLEKARAIRVVNGSAVRKPASCVRVPESQDTNEIRIAAVKTFRIDSIIIKVYTKKGS